MDEATALRNMEMISSVTKWKQELSDSIERAKEGVLSTRKFVSEDKMSKYEELINSIQDTECDIKLFHLHISKEDQSIFVKYEAEMATSPDTDKIIFIMMLWMDTLCSKLQPILNSNYLKTKKDEFFGIVKNFIYGGE